MYVYDAIAKQAENSACLRLSDKGDLPRADR